MSGKAPSAALVGFVSVEEAHRVWRYDPDTGLLYWRISPCNPIPAGSEAGNISDEGYYRISYQRSRYMAHWIVWALVTGSWPTTLIDHKDNDGTNNRFANLREATKYRNAANRRRAAEHRDKLRGVYFRRNRGTWVAVCAREYVGSYATEREAHEAWKKAAVTHYGEFARFD